MMGGRSYPSHVNQVSIWHRDITLVTPRQLKAGQKYSQYQRTGETRQTRGLGQQGRQSRGRSEAQQRQSRQARQSGVILTLK